MPRAHKLTPVHSYQRRDDPIRRLAETHDKAVAREMKKALKHLRELVPTDKIIAHLEKGDVKNAINSVAWDRYAEVLKAPLSVLGTIYEHAGELGGKMLANHSRKQGRGLRYRVAHLRKYSEDEPRDEQGRWTSGGAEAATSLPSSASLSTPPAPTESDMARASRVEDVPLSAARSTQRAMQWDKFNAGDHPPPLVVGYADKPVAVKREDGEYLIFDGHHRTVAAINSGANHLSMHVINARDYAPEFAGRKPSASQPRWTANDEHLFSELTKDAADGFNFDRFDENTRQRLRDLLNSLVVDLTDQAKATINSVVLDGVRAGDSFEDIAANIRDTISLTSTQAQAVANYRRSLEDLDSDALARKLRNMGLDEAVQDAIDSGEFLSDVFIEGAVNDYLENYLDYRAATISRTESLRAGNTGLRDSYQQAAERGTIPDGAVIRRWLLDLDERTCPICKSIVEMNPDGVGLSENFQSEDGPIDDPPVHPNCRCTVQYETNLDMIPEDDPSQSE